MPAAGLSRTGSEALNSGMGDRDDFLEWFNATWRSAEIALHHGDASPRSQAGWRRAPVTFLGVRLDADANTRPAT